MYGDPLSKRGGVSGRIVLETLQDHLPTICSPGFIFIQDNVSTHSCKLVQGWLKEWAAENGVELIDWPPYLPDLNPIENVWHILKSEIMAQYPHLADLPKNDASKRELVRAVICVWEELKEEVLDKLLILMIRRLEVVIAADGWYTKY